MRGTSQGFRFIAGLCILLNGSLALAERPDQISVVGLDENGKPAQAYVSAEKYSAHLGQTLSDMNDSALPVLENHDIFEIKKDRPRWQLRTFIIGVGVQASIGAGPFFRFGIYPRTRLIFSNSITPQVP